MSIALEDVHRPPGDVVARELEGAIISGPWSPAAATWRTSSSPRMTQAKPSGTGSTGSAASRAWLPRSRPSSRGAEDGAGERDLLGLVTGLVERRMLVAF